MRLERIGTGLVIGLLMIMAAFWGLLAIGAPDAEAAPLGVGGTRAALTVTQISRAGVTETLYTADGDGYKFSNNGYVWVKVQNDYTDTITATFVTPGTVDGLPIDDLDIVVPTSTNRLVGPFPPSQYNQPSGTDAGKVYLNFDAAVTGTVASSVTVGAWRVQ